LVTRKYKNHFRTLDNARLELVEASLRANYFTRFPTEYLSSDWGKNDLENHLCRRLNSDRDTIVPWLDDVRPLKGASILEIGCGTGCSTVALAEQGARLEFLRRGRGVSFHEFELAMKPLKSLKIKSSLNLTNRKRGLFGPVKWRRSPEYRYISLLRSIAPDLHEGFLQSFLNLVVEKD
jgi:hypothetical protein